MLNVLTVEDRHVNKQLDCIHWSNTNIICPNAKISRGDIRWFDI